MEIHNKQFVKERLKKTVATSRFRITLSFIPLSVSVCFSSISSLNRYKVSRGSVENSEFPASLCWTGPGRWPVVRLQGYFSAPSPHLVCLLMIFAALSEELCLA